MKPRNSVRILIVTLFAVTAVAAPKPNVLFIMIDDLGWMDTGCYGSTYYETPNVDRLAASGMRFTDAYAASPLCSPTRASILTGQYPMRNGFTSPCGHRPGIIKHETRSSAPPDQRVIGPQSTNILDLEHFTLGKAFKEAGYATAFLGKWHMGHKPYVPENHGFDLVLGGRHHPGPPGTNNPRKFFPPWDADNLPDNPPDMHIDDYLGIRAAEYIHEHKDQPFFMCLWLYEVHAPFQAKPKLFEKWKKKADLNNPQHCPTMGAKIEVMDDNVGRVMDALERAGIADSTIIIFTSDNGGNMYDTKDGTTPTNNEPLRSGKGNNYEGGVRVPLIVRWPGKTKPGSTSEAIVSSVDHYPALLEMTGQPLRPKDHVDGVSYIPALKGQPFDRGPLLFDFPHLVQATMNIPNTAVRHDDWKLYRFWFDGKEQEHRYELYNLKEDVGESRNLAARHPEKVQTMAAFLDRYYKNNPDVLKTNPNKKYAGRTVGVWTAKGAGKIEARDGTLVLIADQDNFETRTRVIPSLFRNCWIEFEARSPKQNAIKVQWTSSHAKKFNEQTAEKALSSDWEPFRVKMDFPGKLSELRFLLSNTGDTAELRNVRLLTQDKSVITEYQFY